MGPSDLGSGAAGSPVQSYYWAHGRESLIGRISPLGLGAGGMMFITAGMALSPRIADRLPEAPLVALSATFLILAMLDIGLAVLVGARPPGSIPSRKLGGSVTFGCDRQRLVSTVVGLIGLSTLGAALVSTGKVSSWFGIFVPVCAAGAVWACYLVARSKTLTVRIDDDGVHDDSFPFRRRLAAWGDITSVGISATTPASAQVVLHVNLEAEHNRESRFRRRDDRHLHVSTSFLTVSASELRDAILSDPAFHVTRADERGH